MTADILTGAYWQQILQEVLQWSAAVVPAVLAILLITFILLKIVKRLLAKAHALWFERLKKSRSVSDVSELEKRADTLLRVLFSVVKIIVWVIALMMILNRLGLNIGPLLAGAGIAGIAVGFGAQQLVKDFISGFFMLLENQIRTGDVAVINGTGGLVESIGMRTTILRDLSGVVHVFQNGKIDTLSNMTKEWSGMVFDIGVAYKEDTDKVMNLMRQTAAELRADAVFKDYILEDMEIFGVDAFADSAVVIKARLKTIPIKQWEVGREYRKRLKKVFDAHDIEIPFPHHTIYWGAEAEALKVKTQK
ncbi:MAG TPA: mechanosensitive ion channel family protein [Spirochaetota bacterium]|nr:mechanosensitive ion channel family protein [Spirochaetota bacterium]